MRNQTQCKKCGQVHERCSAHKKLSKTDGVMTPCRRWPPKGSPVCRVHGVNTQSLVVAQGRVQKEIAIKEATRFAMRQDVDPTTALLELVQYQAGVVAYWRGRVEEVSEKDLTWGIVKKVEKDGLIPMDETHEAAVPSVVYTMLRESQQDLATYASAALRAGVEERRVRIAEQQGEMFAVAQRAILTRMFDTVLILLRKNGIDEDALARGWSEATSIVVPEELRAIAGSAR